MSDSKPKRPASEVGDQRIVLRCTTPLCGGIATMEQKRAPKWARKLRKCQICYERRHWPILDAGEWVPISQNDLAQTSPTKHGHN